MSFNVKSCKKLQLAYLILGIIAFVNLLFTVIIGSINTDSITDERLAHNIEVASEVICYILIVANLLATIFVSVMYFMVRKATTKGMLAFNFSLVFPILVLVGTMFSIHYNIPHLNQVLAQLALIGLFVSFEIFINLIVPVDKKMRYWINSVMFLTAMTVIFGLLSTFVINNSSAVFALTIIYIAFLCASFIDAYYVLKRAIDILNSTENKEVIQNEKLS